MKNKYFNISFDDETKINFIIRLNEDIYENNFIIVISVDNNLSNGEI